jgi:primosomal protein N' (replication factor Y)
MVTRGFGTEKLEEEVEILFPGTRIARMDLDTTRSRRKYEKIIRDFESGNTQILVGTQIVTKGLDFDNVALVGVLHADNLLNFPDFRAHERGFQLISQVSGRKERQGKVVIQSSLPEHPVIRHLLRNDYHGMYLSQMEDRKGFHYPPYYRLVRITLRHASKTLLEKASTRLGAELRKRLLKSSGAVPIQQPEILGPQSPLIGKVQQMYLMTLLIKLPRTPEITVSKKIIGEVIQEMRSDRRYGKLFVVPDVDPY